MHQLILFSDHFLEFFNRMFFLKKIDVNEASGMNKFLAGSCLSGLGFVLKKPYGMKPFVKTKDLYK
jgi:hypothetical protein